MTDPSLNELIEAHREEVHLGLEQKARARTRLLAQAGMGASVAALSVGAAARTASHAAAFFAKITWGLAGLGVIGWGYYLTHAEPKQMHVAPSAHNDDRRPVNTLAEREGRKPEIGEVNAPARESAATTLAPRELAKASSSTKAVAAPSKPATLADEVRIMQEVDAALRSGNGNRALQLLSERKLPETGGLAEERAAARVFALCNLGKLNQARGEVERFLRSFPRSPLAARVRSSCGAPRAAK